MDTEAPFQLIRDALRQFIDTAKGNSFSENTRRTIGELRSYFWPNDDDSYFVAGSFDAMGRENTESYAVNNVLNPTPYEVVKRATSGFLSFHHTPWDAFFKTTPIALRALSSDEAKDMEEYWQGRDLRTHYIMQQPYNVMNEALFIASRLVFNLGVKVLEEDANLQIKKVAFPVESLMLQSSDGINMDIQGVYEDLTWFQFKRKYGTQYVMPRKRAQEDARAMNRAYDFSRRAAQASSSMRGDIRTYKFNAPVGVFKAFLEGYINSKGDSQHGAFVLDQLNKFLSDEGKILDFVCDEEGNLITMNAQTYRTIIVGYLGFITKDGVRGKSQADAALSTAKTLQHAELILVDGFSKKFGPAWLFPTALERRAYRSMSHLDIIYSDAADEKGVRPIGLNVDLREAQLLIENWQERIKNIMFNDVWTLIDKSRMPASEISLRRSDGFRQLGLYVAADTCYNLEPEVLSIMQIDEMNNKLEGPPLKDAVLSTQYISPVIQSIKATRLDEYDRMITFYRNADAIPPDGRARRIVDVDRIIRDGTIKSDKAVLLRTVEETNNLDRQEELRKQLEQERMRAETMRINNENIKVASEAMGGEGAATGVPG